jgi:cobalt/nickel transport system permease protein
VHAVLTPDPFSPLRHATFAQLSLGRSAVHVMDARAKLVLLVAALVALSLARTPTVRQLLSLWLSLVGIAFIAKLPVLRVVGLSLLGVSFAAFFAVILYTTGDRGRAVILMEKSYLSAFLVLIAAATTTLPALSAAARFFRIPSLLTEVIELVHRYLFVLIGEVQSMRVAFTSRAGRPGRRAFQASSGMVAVLFARSLERSGRLFRSMCSRGFEGTLPSHRLPPLKGTDVIWTLAGIAFLTGWSYL